MEVGERRHTGQLIVKPLEEAASILYRAPQREIALGKLSWSQRDLANAGPRGFESKEIPGCPITSAISWGRQSAQLCRTLMIFWWWAGFSAKQISSCLRNFRLFSNACCSSNWPKERDSPLIFKNIFPSISSWLKQAIKRLPRYLSSICADTHCKTGKRWRNRNKTLYNQYLREL